MQQKDGSAHLQVFKYIPSNTHFLHDFIAALLLCFAEVLLKQQWNNTKQYYNVLYCCVELNHLDSGNYTCEVRLRTQVLGSITHVVSILGSYVSNRYQHFTYQCLINLVFAHLIFTYVAFVHLAFAYLSFAYLSFAYLISTCLTFAYLIFTFPSLTLSSLT